MKFPFHAVNELPSVRIPGSERLLRLNAISGKFQGKESLFTLHSAAGFRLPNGTIEIERIAGFCHERRMLRTFWLHRIHSMTDMASGEAITDIAAWLDANELKPVCQEPGEAAQDDLPQQDASAWPVMAKAANAASAIDAAMRCALDQSDFGIAERLFRIGALLKNGAGTAC